MKKDCKYVVVLSTGKSCMVDSKTEADTMVAESLAADASVEITLFKQISAPKAKTGTRVKRTTASLTDLKNKILSTLNGTPVNASALAKTLGVTTKELILPMRQLVASKLVVAEGKKRGVKYSAMPAVQG